MSEADDEFLQEEVDWLHEAAAGVARMARTPKERAYVAKIRALAAKVARRIPKPEPI